MTKLLILRSGTKGNRPTGKSYGEPYVNFAENQFGVINSSGGAQDLLGVPIFSTTQTYTAGQPVNYGGQIYVALGAVAAGAFTPAQWSLAATQAWATGSFIGDAPNDGNLYGRQNLAWAKVPSRIYFGGTIVPTNLGINVSSVNSSTGVITFASAHGLTTGQLLVLTGTVPAGLITLATYYCHVLSTTTIALYNDLIDAKADTNRVVPTATTSGWSVRVITYTGVNSSGFDPVCPIGNQGGAISLHLELNLSSPLPQTTNVLVFLERINGMFSNETTPISHSTWASNQPPTIVNSQLLGFYSSSSWYAYGGSPLAICQQGTWQSQAQNSFYFGCIVIDQ